MPQKPFIPRYHFYLPDGKGRNSPESAAHHVEYMGSKKKAELLIDGLLSETVNDRSLRSAAIHAKYAGEREGSLGYFGTLAHDPRRAQDSILHAQGPVWRIIASVGEEDAQAMGGDLLTKAGWEKAASPVVAKTVEMLGLDPNKVQWIAAVHRHQKHEHNPHLHLLFWEVGEPTRKTGKWTLEEMRAVRREWVSALYGPERVQLGQQKSEARTQARQHVIDLVKANLKILKNANVKVLKIARRKSPGGLVLKRWWRRAGRDPLQSTDGPGAARHAQLVAGNWRSDYPMATSRARSGAGGHGTPRAAFRRRSRFPGRQHPRRPHGACAPLFVA